MITFKANFVVFDPKKELLSPLAGCKHYTLDDAAGCLFTI